MCRSRASVVRLWSAALLELGLKFLDGVDCSRLVEANVGILLGRGGRRRRGRVIGKPAVQRAVVERILIEEVVDRGAVRRRSVVGRLDAGVLRCVGSPQCLGGRPLAAVARRSVTENKKVRAEK